MKGARGLPRHGYKINAMKTRKPKYNAEQLEFAAFESDWHKFWKKNIASTTWEECSHQSCYESNAYVPSGIFCSRCKTLLLQFLPEPPETIGYITADWAWHYRDGKPWTTQEPPGTPPRPQQKKMHPTRSIHRKIRAIMAEVYQ